MQMVNRRLEKEERMGLGRGWGGRGPVAAQDVRVGLLEWATCNIIALFTEKIRCQILSETDQSQRSLLLLQLACSNHFH